MLKHKFGRRSRTRRKNGLFFFHNQYIVYSRFVNLCVTYIFKISRNILLTIQIIRTHTHISGTLLSHFHDLLAVLKGHFFVFILEQVQSRRPFQCQGMNRQAVRMQFFYLLQRMCDFFFSLARKTDDQIHIDIVKFQFSCHMENVDRIFHCMFSSNHIQGFLIHGLWIHGDSCHRKFFHHLQFFSCNTVRSSSFHCIFFYPGKIKRFLNVRKQSA